MLSHSGTAAMRRGVSTLACCLFCVACSSPDPEEAGGADVFGLLGFMLANALGVTDGRGPADADATAERAPEAAREALASATLRQDPQDPQNPDPPGGEEPTSCEVAYSGPVTIVTVRTPRALARAMADRRPIPIVYSTDDTAAYEDGQVLTSNVEAVGDHLNALGWVQNPMRIAGAGTGVYASAVSYDRSRDSSSSKPKIRRKRRRRG